MAEGAVLTHKAIQQIKVLQDDNNEMAKNAARIVADAISAIMQCNEQVKGIVRNPEKLVTELTYVRDIFGELERP